MTTVHIPLALAAVYLWIGFVCAISFLEAWLKFRAPGITVGLGLGIGRLVFNALNKAEWIFAMVIIVATYLAKEDLFSADRLSFYISFAILLAQTFWLLPALDARAIMHMKGMELPPSNNHIYYVAMEVVKVICLVLFSLTLFS